MSKKKKSKVKKVVIRGIIILIVLFVLIALYAVVYKQNNIQDIFAGVEAEEALISEYIIYGTHFNIEGTLDIETSNIADVKLTLKTIDSEESEEIDMIYENTSDGIEFTTSELINEGIDLEEMAINTYYMFVKVEYSDGTEKYYSLKDNADYEENADLEYYTITKNSQNNKIEIKFANYNSTEQKLEYMYMNVSHTTLPDDVYDVVIDPGHGGTDVGAVYGNYSEADLVLEIAQKVKEELEELGLKVKITRDGTEGDDYTVYTIYDEDGRVTVVRRF